MSYPSQLVRGVLFSVLAFAICVNPARATVTVGWLPVPPEDLALKDNPKQPGADAMILYRENTIDARKTFTDGDAAREYIRIKIFTQAGTKYGHVEVPFVKGSEDVSVVTGRTILPDGSIVKFDGQVLETTVEKSGGFKLLVKTFTLPDVQPGCIIEYKYELGGKREYVHNRSWSVSQDIYTREAHFTYFPYEGYGGLGLTPRYRPHHLPADAVLTHQSDDSYSMEVHDIPAVEQETLMLPDASIDAGVDFYYDGPDDPSESDPTDKFWNNYGKKRDAELEHFIDKKNALNAEVAKIVAPADSPEVKLRKIYARVLQIRNLDLEDYKTMKESKDENLKPDNNVEDVLSRGYANAQQVNFLFVGLARAAGFDATEEYVLPRSLDITFAPDLKQTNELQGDVVWVKAGAQEYHLDPGARYYPFGLLPWYEMAVAGIKVSKTGGQIVTTIEENSADAILVRSADLTVADDDALSGTLQVDFGAQYGASLREDKRQEDDTGRTTDIENEVKEWLPNGSEFEITKISDWDDVEKPVHVEGTVKIPSPSGGVMLQRMLVPRVVFRSGQSGWFSTTKRVNDIYFPYPFQETDDVKLHWPSVYKTQSVPATPKLDLGGAYYEITAEPVADGIEVKRHMALNGYLFPKTAYPSLRAFFGAVRTYDDTEMVLQSGPSPSTRPN